LLQWILYIVIFLAEVAIFASVHSRSVRQVALLAGSYVLYLTWGPWFAGVLLGSTVMNYLLGAWMRRTPTWQRLWIGILLNVALLGSFKYLPEVASQLPFSSLQRFAHLALPLGISFWTFQALSYLFDLYSGEELNPSFIEFALYMVFFPVTISGPVCRLTEMLPQFRAEQPLNWGEAGIGFRRVATGFLMMQFAKLLSHGILGGDGITSGFDRLHHWSGPDAWCLAFGYGLQLFFDFAGYSHMAIGAAQILGLTVPENFARPFASTSPSIFWTRWHMSLSFWIRDYVFLPLAMLRREVWWRNLALVIAMVLFGLWHKASVLFILWGAFHGILLVLHRVIQQLQRAADWDPPLPLWNVLSWATTIGLVSLGWIFFRANSLVQAEQMFSGIVSPASYASRYLSGSLYLLVLTLAGGYALVVTIADSLERHGETPGDQASPGIMAWLGQKRWLWIPPLYLLTLLVLLIVNATQGASAAQFMYRTF
jgi:D-alanyl-lipoteichoic acid acyltransferase DltB (MBOAT superfamily)